MSFLRQILETKRARLASILCRGVAPELVAEARAVRAHREPHLLRAALSNRGRVNVIAEIKRASPSKGEIRRGAEPPEIALAYSRGGASAISVLTEEDYFRGSLADLRAVRKTVSLPVLRKDFIVDEVQVYEAAAAGADAVLLIVAALDDEQLMRLRRLTEETLGLDALVEVHTADEMRRARASGATLIGVNNRDLETFRVSVEVSERLAREAAADALLVSESGLRSGEDLRRLRALGYNGFLVGEALMRAACPEAELRSLLREAGA